MTLEMVTDLERCVWGPDKNTLRAWRFCKILSKRAAIDADAIGRVWLPAELWERCRRLVVVTLDMREPERWVACPYKEWTLMSAATFAREYNAYEVRKEAALEAIAVDLEQADIDLDAVHPMYLKRQARRADY